MRTNDGALKTKEVKEHSIYSTYKQNSTNYKGDRVILKVRVNDGCILHKTPQRDWHDQ